MYILRSEHGGEGKTKGTGRFHVKLGVIQFHHHVKGAYVALGKVMGHMDHRVNLHVKGKVSIYLT